MTEPAKTASFRVSFADHSRFGKQPDALVTDFGGHPTDGFRGFGTEDLVAILPKVLEFACREAAARYVSFEDTIAAGKSDSDYLDLRDRMATSFRPTAMSPERGLEKRRFRCNGIYLNSDGDGWTGFVMAADEDEARFQAKWQMALASSGDPRKRDDFQVLMDGCGIDFVAPEPVLVEELAEAAKDLLSEIGGSSGEAYDRVAALLGKLGIEAGATRSPRI